MVVACNSRPFICNTHYAHSLYSFFADKISSVCSTPVTTLLPLSALHTRVPCINNWLICTRGVCFHQQTCTNSVHTVGICVRTGTEGCAGQEPATFSGLSNFFPGGEGHLFLQKSGTPTSSPHELYPR